VQHHVPGHAQGVDEGARTNTGVAGHKVAAHLANVGNDEESLDVVGQDQVAEPGSLAEENSNLFGFRIFAYACLGREHVQEGPPTLDVFRVVGNVRPPGRKGTA
jgi:hypothetical protein